MGGTELDPQEDTQALLGLVESNDLEGVEKLLGEETKTHVNDELLGVTPLMIASSLGYVDVVEALVSERPIAFCVGSKISNSWRLDTFLRARSWSARRTSRRRTWTARPPTPGRRTS